MKKILFIIVISVVLFLMPIISSTSVKTNVSHISKTIATPLVDDYDGTFVGGMGRVYKEDGEWQYEVNSYIGGVYRDRNYKTLYGNIYNLDEEKIGTLTMISNKIFLIGRITDLEDHKAPITGLIFDYGEDKFIGRIMSLFGPAPHIFGKYTPN